MENKRNGWAFGLGVFDGAYQLVAGLVLILFCSKIGGIPYGLALILSGVACGVVTFFAHKHKWAKLTLLLLGVAGIVGVFALGYLIEKIGGFKQGSESIVLLMRIIAFYSGLTLLLSGLWNFDVRDGQAKKLIISSIVYKVVLLLGVAVCAAISALTFWQLTENATFTEWLYGLVGDESLTGSALIEAQILARSEFVQWVRNVAPVFEGIGILLISLTPTYAWYLDSEGILLGKRSVLGSIITCAAGAPFLIVAEIVLIGEFISTGSIASLIFGIVTLLAFAAAWFFFYWFPVLRGKRSAIFYNDAPAALASAEDEAPVMAEA